MKRLSKVRRGGERQLNPVQKVYFSLFSAQGYHFPLGTGRSKQRKRIYFWPKEEGRKDKHSFSLCSLFILRLIAHIFPFSLGHLSLSAQSEGRSEGHRGEVDGHNQRGNNASERQAESRGQISPQESKFGCREEPGGREKERNRSDSSWRDCAAESRPRDHFDLRPCVCHTNQAGSEPISAAQKKRPARNDPERNENGDGFRKTTETGQGQEEMAEVIYASRNGDSRSPRPGKHVRGRLNVKEKRAVMLTHQVSIEQFEPVSWTMDCSGQKPVCTSEGSGQRETFLPSDFGVRHERAIPLIAAKRIQVGEKRAGREENGRNGGRENGEEEEERFLTGKNGASSRSVEVQTCPCQVQPTTACFPGAQKCNNAPSLSPTTCLENDNKGKSFSGYFPGNPGRYSEEEEGSDETWWRRDLRLCSGQQRKNCCCVCSKKKVMNSGGIAGEECLAPSLVPAERDSDNSSTKRTQSRAPQGSMMIHRHGPLVFHSWGKQKVAGRGPCIHRYFLPGTCVCASKGPREAVSSVDHTLRLVVLLPKGFFLSSLPGNLPFRFVSWEKVFTSGSLN